MTSRPRARLDRILVERGLAPTRAKAQALILAGQVHTGQTRLDKPGMRHPPDIPLRIAEGRRYVGRGAHKLLAALRRFRIDVAGKPAIDVGASTGGFTQVLLERGAGRVIALDVGHGQLDWGLRNDPRVFPLEGVNARYLSPGALPFIPHFGAVDVSFISLERILPPVVDCLAPGGELVTLIKPQFEAGRDKVGRGGLVKDPGVHREVLRRYTSSIVHCGWSVVDLCPSPLPGARGNREFLAHVRPSGDGLDAAAVAARIEACVAEPDLTMQAEE